MKDYSAGVREGPQEAEYLEWIAQNPLGIVVSARRGKDMRWTVHRAHCATVNYDLLAKGQHTRSGKLCFENEREFKEWCGAQEMATGEFNECSRCHSRL